MLRQLRSLLKQAALLIIVLFFLLSLCWIAPQPASAYSLKDLKKQANEARAAITETTSDISKSTIQTAASASADIGSKVLDVSKATFKESMQVGTKVGSTAWGAGKIATYKALETSSTIGSIALKAGKSVTEIAIDAGEDMNDKALEVGTKVGSTAWGAGKIATSKALETSSTLGSVALKAGKSVTEMVIDASEDLGDKALEVKKIGIKTAENVGSAATQKTVLLAQQAATGVKFASEAIADQITEAFKLYAQPLLEAAINQVDVNQIEAVVRQVQHEISEHSSEAVAKQFIARKMLESLQTENWIEIARLQAEMIYQIAAAYGFELHDTVRKQEILEIAATNLGSGQILKTSMPLIRYAIGQIPVAGDALGVAVDWGSDRLIRSLMFPLLGQAACKYYTNLQSSSIAQSAFVSARTTNTPSPI